MIENLKSLIDQRKVEQVLKKKSTEKESVRSLQIALYELGYGKELNWDKYQADGDFGNSTVSAIKAFAANNGLNSQGEVVTPDMAKKIVAQYETVEDLRTLKKAVDAKLLNKLKRKSSDKPMVSSLQRLLNSLGYGEQLNWQKYGADGSFGNGTASAIKAFGTKEGIQTNGDAVDEPVANRILDKFVPFLGDGWAEAKAERKARRKAKKGKGQYYRLHPEGDRDFKGIEKKRKGFEAEVYKVDKTTKKSILREYRYEFDKARHKIEGENLEMTYYDVKKLNKAGQRIMSFCYKKDHPKNKKKDRVIVHFTAGQTLGDLKTITREDYHVSTAYILGRDGTIYRLFSPEQWSYHLGAKQFGHDSRGIGIEISNYGYLKEDGAGNLTFGAGHTYCSLDDTDAYVKLDKPFRGFSYYAAYTDKQTEGLIILLRYLTKTYNIARQFVPSDPAKEAAGDWENIPRYSVFKSKAEADAFKGICTHINYRTSGKWDLGPAFPWEEVIAGVTAEEFKPSFGTRARSLLAGGPFRTEEDHLAELANVDHGNQDTSIYGPDGPDVDI